MSLQHGTEKQLNSTCGINECIYLYSTVDTIRSHVTKCHKDCLVQLPIDSNDILRPATEIPVLDDIEMGPVDDTESVSNSQSLLAEFSDFLKDFGKTLCFIQLQMREKYVLPLSTSSAIFCEIKSLFDLFQMHFCSVI